MKLQWKKVDDNLTDDNYIAMLDNFVWEVSSAARRTDEFSDKFVAYRDFNNYTELFDDGYLDKKGMIICGAGTFCAIGLPESQYFDTLEEAKQVCEIDADRLYSEKEEYKVYRKFSHEYIKRYR